MKKAISLLLTLAMLMTCCASAFALEYGAEWAGYTETQTAKYKDVPPTHWAFDAVERASATKWFSGYPDGTFRPDASITRAEAMKVFVVFLGLQLKDVTNPTYYDVKPEAWYAPYVEAGKKLFPERVQYNGQVPFQPEMPITREDAIYALVIALKYNDLVQFADQSILNMFSDQNSISSHVKPYAAVAIEKGLVSGHANGTIGGQDPLTRAQFATLLYRGSTIGFGTGGGLADVPETTPIPAEPTAAPTAEPTAAPTAAPSAAPTAEPTTAPTTAPAANGIVDGKVAYANDRSTGIEGATVAFSNGTTVTTDANGKYSATLPAGNYTVKASKAGYTDAQISLDVAADTTNYAETMYLAEPIENGSISGTVQDAFVQNGVVPGATLKFREGGDNKTGDVIKTVTAGDDGKYSVELPSGTYTVEGSKEGYITAYKNVTSTAEGSTEDISLTPEYDGEYRVILTWGETPRDLDSHLTGPVADGTRFHVAYYAMNATDNGANVANLDRDDVTSYGPETVTILEQIDGVYRYSVHDYTNRRSTSSNAMSNSGAKVELYKGEHLVATYNMPTNVVGTVWTVFEINGSTITPINTISTESNPSAVSGGKGTGNDVAAIAQAPDKE